MGSNPLERRIWIFKYVPRAEPVFYTEWQKNGLWVWYSKLVVNDHQFCIFQNLITTSWELWKHPDPVPGGRPIFFKPKWPKESKNGFKTISCRPPLLLIFSKNCFSTKKNVEKIGHLVDFWILMAIYMDKLDQFKKKLIAGRSESVEILPKC